MLNGETTHTEGFHTILMLKNKVWNKECLEGISSSTVAPCVFSLFCEWEQRFMFLLIREASFQLSDDRSL